MRDYIYLDNAATTFPKPECVYTAIDEANRTLAVNAGRGSYALAQRAASVISETKNEIRKLANACGDAKVILTASATLACNQVLCGMEWSQDSVVYVSPYEHNAVMRVLYGLQKKFGFFVEELGINTDTLELDLKRIEYQFMRKCPSVVVITHVSNVLGYVLPIREVAKMAQQYKAEVVIDGAQAFGGVPVNLQKIPADYYIFAGHKMLYGPFGTGGFLKCTAKQLYPVLSGGTGSDSLNLEMDTATEEGLEPGSHNIAAIAGLLAALKEGDREEQLKKEQALSVYLIDKLENLKGVKVYRMNNLNRQTGIVSFNIEGFKADEVGMILDEDYHIAVRTGYQCAPLIHKYLHSGDYGGVVRAGLGRFTTAEELDCLTDAVREIIKG